MPTQQHRIGSGFGARSTAADVLHGIDLSGKLAIVTGGYSGIGLETTRALAGAGAQVVVPARRRATAEEALAGVHGVEMDELDLADLDSVREFAERFLASGRNIDIVINNAGIMACPETRVGPGWEAQFATNHLGHFALALGLHDALAAAGGARIVSVSSRGHMRSPVVFDDLNFASRPYDPWLAYGQSKTANVLFAVEATRRWRDSRITANAVHPGAILETNLTRHMDPEYLAQLRASATHAETYDGSRLRYKTLEQGAATSVLVATSPLLEGVGGRYFEDCNQARILDPNEPDTSSSGVAAYALDLDNANRLWEVSAQLVA